MIRPPALIAVTGSTGQVGLSVASRLKAEGYGVRALTRQGVFENGARLDRFAPFDIAVACDPAFLEGCDALVHLAAYVPKDSASEAEAERCFIVNALGSARLLESAKSAGVTRVIHTGAASAYAYAPSPRSESDPLFPSRRAPYYLMSKVAEEVFAAHWGRESGASVCCLRLAPVYSPNRAGLLTRWVAAALAGQPLRVSNGGLYAADFLFADDAAKAIVAALHTGADGPINIGSGEWRRLSEVAALIVEIVGASRGLIETDPVTAPDDVGFPPIAIAKARDILGFSPTSLNDGLSSIAAALSGRAT